PPPSSTICGPLLFTTFAVACIVMVTGSGPQEKVMTPPAATAATTAADVQLPGVPLPMTRLGRLVSTARASAGTAAVPLGLPAAGKAVLPCEGVGWPGLALDWALADGGTVAAFFAGSLPQPVRAPPT